MNFSKPKLVSKKFYNAGQRADTTTASSGENSSVLTHYTKCHKYYTTYSIIDTTNSSCKRAVKVILFADSLVEFPPAKYIGYIYIYIGSMNIAGILQHISGPQTPGPL